MGEEFFVHHESDDGGSGAGGDRTGEAIVVEGEGAVLVVGPAALGGLGAAQDAVIAQPHAGVQGAAAQCHAVGGFRFSGLQSRMTAFDAQAGVVIFVVGGVGELRIQHGGCGHEAVRIGADIPVHVGVLPKLQSVGQRLAFQNEDAFVDADAALNGFGEDVLAGDAGRIREVEVDLGVLTVDLHRGAVKGKAAILQQVRHGHLHMDAVQRHSGVAGDGVTVHGADAAGAAGDGHRAASQDGLGGGGDVQVGIRRGQGVVHAEDADLVAVDVQTAAGDIREAIGADAGRPGGNGDVGTVNEEVGGGLLVRQINGEQGTAVLGGVGADARVAADHLQDSALLAGDAEIAGDLDAAAVEAALVILVYHAQGIDEAVGALQIEIQRLGAVQCGVEGEFVSVVIVVHGAVAAALVGEVVEGEAVVLVVSPAALGGLLVQNVAVLIQPAAAGEAHAAQHHGIDPLGVEGPAAEEVGVGGETFTVGLGAPAGEDHSVGMHRHRCVLERGEVDVPVGGACGLRAGEVGIQRDGDASAQIDRCQGRQRLSGRDGGIRDEGSVDVVAVDGHGRVAGRELQVAVGEGDDLIGDGFQNRRCAEDRAGEIQCAAVKAEGQCAFQGDVLNDEGAAFVGTGQDAAQGGHQSGAVGGGGDDEPGAVGGGKAGGNIGGGSVGADGEVVAVEIQCHLQIAVEQHPVGIPDVLQKTDVEGGGLVISGGGAGCVLLQEDHEGLLQIAVAGEVIGVGAPCYLRLLEPDGDVHAAGGHLEDHGLALDYGLVAQLVAVGVLDHHAGAEVAGVGGDGDGDCGAVVHGEAADVGGDGAHVAVIVQRQDPARHGGAADPAHVPLVVGAVGEVRAADEAAVKAGMLVVEVGVGAGFPTGIAAAAAEVVSRTHIAALGALAAQNSGVEAQEAAGVGDGVRLEVRQSDLVGGEGGVRANIAQTDPEGIAVMGDAGIHEGLQAVEFAAVEVESAGGGGAAHIQGEGVFRQIQSQLRAVGQDAHGTQEAEAAVIGVPARGAGGGEQGDLRAGVGLCAAGAARFAIQIVGCGVGNCFAADKTGDAAGVAGGVIAQTSVGEVIAAGAQTRGAHVVRRQLRVGAPQGAFAADAAGEGRVGTFRAAALAGAESRPGVGQLIGAADLAADGTGEGLVKAVGTDGAQLGEGVFGISVEAAAGEEHEAALILHIEGRLGGIGVGVGIDADHVLLAGRGVEVHGGDRVLVGQREGAVGQGQRHPAAVGQETLQPQIVVVSGRVPAVTVLVLQEESERRVGLCVADGAGAAIQIEAAGVGRVDAADEAAGTAHVTDLILREAGVGVVGAAGEAAAVTDAAGEAVVGAGEVADGASEVVQIRLVGTFRAAAGAGAPGPDVGQDGGAAVGAAAGAAEILPHTGVGAEDPEAEGRSRVSGGAGGSEQPDGGVGAVGAAVHIDAHKDGFLRAHVEVLADAAGLHAGGHGVGIGRQVQGNGGVARHQQELHLMAGVAVFIGPAGVVVAEENDGIRQIGLLAAEGAGFAVHVVGGGVGGGDAADQSRHTALAAGTVRKGGMQAGIGAEGADAVLIGFVAALHAADGAGLAAMIVVAGAGGAAVDAHAAAPAVRDAAAAAEDAADGTAVVVAEGLVGAQGVEDAGELIVAVLGEGFAFKELQAAFVVEDEVVGPAAFRSGGTDGTEAVDVVVAVVDVERLGAVGVGEGVGADHQLSAVREQAHQLHAGARGPAVSGAGQEQADRAVGSLPALDALAAAIVGCGVGDIFAADQTFGAADAADAVGGVAAVGSGRSAAFQTAGAAGTVGKGAVGAEGVHSGQGVGGVAVEVGGVEERGLAVHHLKGGLVGVGAGMGEDLDAVGVVRVVVEVDVQLLAALVAGIGNGEGADGQVQGQRRAVGEDAVHLQIVARVTAGSAPAVAVGVQQAEGDGGVRHRAALFTGRALQIVGGGVGQADAAEEVAHAAGIAHAVTEAGVGEVAAADAAADGTGTGLGQLGVGAGCAAEGADQVIAVGLVGADRAAEGAGAVLPPVGQRVTAAEGAAAQTDVLDVHLAVGADVEHRGEGVGGVAVQRGGGEEHGLAVQHLEGGLTGIGAAMGIHLQQVDVIGVVVEGDVQRLVGGVVGQGEGILGQVQEHLRAVGQTAVQLQVVVLGAAAGGPAVAVGVLQAEGDGGVRLGRAHGTGRALQIVGGGVAHRFAADQSRRAALVTGLVLRKAGVAEVYAAFQIAGGAGTFSVHRGVGAGHAAGGADAAVVPSVGAGRAADAADALHGVVVAVEGGQLLAGPAAGGTGVCNVKFLVAAEDVDRAEIVGGIVVELLAEEQLVSFVIQHDEVDAAGLHVGVGEHLHGVDVALIIIEGVLRLTVRCLFGQGEGVRGQVQGHLRAVGQTAGQLQIVEIRAAVILIGAVPAVVGDGVHQTEGEGGVRHCAALAAGRALQIVGGAVVGRVGAADQIRGAALVAHAVTQTGVGVVDAAGQAAVHAEVAVHLGVGADVAADLADAVGVAVVFTFRAADLADAVLPRVGEQIVAAEAAAVNAGVVLVKAVVAQQAYNAGVDGAHGVPAVVAKAGAAEAARFGGAVQHLKGALAQKTVRIEPGPDSVGLALRVVEGHVQRVDRILRAGHGEGVSGQGQRPLAAVGVGAVELQVDEVLVAVLHPAVTGGVLQAEDDGGVRLRLTQGTGSAFQIIAVAVGRVGAAHEVSGAALVAHAVTQTGVEEVGAADKAAAVAGAGFRQLGVGAGDAAEAALAVDKVIVLAGKAAAGAGAVLPQVGQQFRAAGGVAERADAVGEGVAADDIHLREGALRISTEVLGDKKNLAVPVQNQEGGLRGPCLRFRIDLQGVGFSGADMQGDFIRARAFGHDKRGVHLRLGAVGQQAHHLQVVVQAAVAVVPAVAVGVLQAQGHLRRGLKAADGTSRAGEVEIGAVSACAGVCGGRSRCGCAVGAVVTGDALFVGMHVGGRGAGGNGESQQHHDGEQDTEQFAWHKISSFVGWEIRGDTGLTGSNQSILTDTIIAKMWKKTRAAGPPAENFT